MVFSSEISLISTQDEKWICWQVMTSPNRAPPRRSAKYHGTLERVPGWKSAVTCWGPHFKEKRQYKVSVQFLSLRLLGIGWGALPQTWGNFIQMPQITTVRPSYKHLSAATHSHRFSRGSPHESKPLPCGISFQDLHNVQSFNFLWQPLFSQRL